MVLGCELLRREKPTARAVGFEFIRSMCTNLHLHHAHLLSLHIVHAGSTHVAFAHLGIRHSSFFHHSHFRGPILHGCAPMLIDLAILSDVQAIIAADAGVTAKTAAIPAAKTRYFM